MQHSSTSSTAAAHRQKRVAVAPCYNSTTAPQLQVVHRYSQVRGWLRYATCSPSPKNPYGKKTMKNPYEKMKNEKKKCSSHKIIIWKGWRRVADTYRSSSRRLIPCFRIPQCHDRWLQQQTTLCSLARALSSTLHTVWIICPVTVEWTNNHSYCHGNRCVDQQPELGFFAVITTPPDPCSSTWRLALVSQQQPQLYEV